VRKKRGKLNLNNDAADFVAIILNYQGRC